MSESKSKVISCGCHVVDAEGSPVAWLAVPGNDDACWGDCLGDKLDIVRGNLAAQNKAADGCIMKEVPNAS